MKSVKIKELRNKSTEELRKELQNLQDNLLKTRFKAVVDDITDTSVIKKTKKSIAKIKTLIRERELKAGSLN